MPTAAAPDERRAAAGATPWQRWGLLDALGVLSAAPIFIEDTAVLSIGTIRSKACRLRMRQPLDLLIVDYLQLATGDSLRRNGNCMQEVDDISRGLKALARDLVGTLHQLPSRLAGSVGRSFYRTACRSTTHRSQQQWILHVRAWTYSPNRFDVCHLHAGSRQGCDGNVWSLRPLHSPGCNDHYPDAWRA